MSDVVFAKESGSIWMPVYTLPRNEKKVYANFLQKGISAYLPQKRHVNIQPIVSKGKKYSYKRILHVPMFPGYVFARISPDVRSDLMRDRSVIRVLPVTEYEEDELIRELQVIHQLEVFSEEKPLDVTNGLQVGEKVIFTDGPFKDFQGIIASLKHSGLVSINIRFVQASVTMEYPAAWCKVFEE